MSPTSTLYSYSPSKLFNGSYYLLSTGGQSSTDQFCIDVSYLMPPWITFSPNVTLNFDNNLCTNTSARTIVSTIPKANPTMSIDVLRTPSVSGCVPVGLSTMIFNYTFSVSYQWSPGPLPYKPT